MTSSLVGSEMCIRDRAVPMLTCPIAGGEHTCWNCAACWMCQPPTVVIPVSYTHLTLPTICSV
eukprot:12417789-Prorocentrum_lima.AAC.1